MSTITTAPAEIMWMPAGTHIICATINGKPGRRRVVVEESIVPKLNADLAAKHAAAAAHQAARPVVYFDHKQGAAAAFPQRFRWVEGLGIMLELAGWSQAGRVAVEGGNYGYISPSFLIDRRSSRVLGLTEGVEICSLVNDPAFECIHPILDAVAASRSHDAPEPEGVDVVGSSHCNQQHIPNCPNVNDSSVQLAQDTTGLQAHLNDEVHPVEINFTPENLNLKQLRKEGKTEEYNAARKRWLNEFKEHYQAQLAGKTLEVEGSGHSIYFPDTSDAKSRAAKGVRNQARAEAGKNIAQAVASSYHLHQSTPEHKEGEGEYRRKMVDTSDSFHVFGCPITVNGERSLMWIAASHKKAEANQKNLVFYEFGVAESTKKAGGVPLVHGTSSHRTGTPPVKATLLDVLRDVKSDFQGKPKFLQKEDEAKSAKKGRGDENFTRPSPGIKPASPGKDIKAQRENAVKDNFYEFGVADSVKKSGGLSLVQNPKIPSLDKPPAKAILADAPRDVKTTHASHCNQHEHAPGCSHGSGKEGGSSSADDAEKDADKAYFDREEERERLEKLLSILEEEEESARDAESAGDGSMHRPEYYREKWNNTAREGDPLTREQLEKRIAELQDAAKSARTDFSPRDDIAKNPPVSENDTAKATQNITMNENIKKKLGLAPDASDEDVEAAITKLAADRDAHKKKAEEFEAACKKKDDELKAARAAEKEAWLAELKKSGRLAPQDEEAINAASALYDANADAARIAYAKLPAADDAPVIKAAAAGSHGTAGDKVEDFIEFPNN